MHCAIPLFLSLTLLVQSALSDTVGCFSPSPPSSPTQLTPTTYKACHGVLSFIIDHDKTKGAIPFSRKPGIGYRLPDYWVSGNCVVAIDMHSDNDVDSMSFHDIAIEAGVIMVRCVMHSPHLGGTQPVGPKKVMNVTVFGNRARPGRKPWHDLSLGGNGKANVSTV